MSLLLLDIGNTNIKSGEYKNGSINNFLVHTSNKNFFEYIKNTSMHAVAISSVVPSRTKDLLNFFEKMNLPKPFVISINSLFNLKINYSTPASLGIDRICSSEGAFKYCRENNLLDGLSFILTIDFGTATTINVTTVNGIFLGGIISPGINTMFNSLKQNTAQLPMVSIIDYKEFIGDDTVSSIASGVINSTIGLIERVIRNLEEKRPEKKVMCFITGGNAESIAGYLHEKFILDHTLVLKGLEAIYELNNPDNKVKQ